MGKKYYCKVRKGKKLYTNYFKTVEQAEKAAIYEMNKSDTQYVEYGVCKFDGWFGESILSIVKPGVPYGELSD